MSGKTKTQLQEDIIYLEERRSSQVLTIGGLQEEAKQRDKECAQLKEENKRLTDDLARVKEVRDEARRVNRIAYEDGDKLHRRLRDLEKLYKLWRNAASAAAIAQMNLTLAEVEDGKQEDKEDGREN